MDDHWWKASEATKSERHPRNTASDDPEIPNIPLLSSSGGAYNNDFFQLISGSSDDPSVVKDLPSAQSIRVYNLWRRLKKETTLYQPGMTFKQVRDWLQQCAKPEALAKLGTQTSNIRLTLTPTTAKETYARKYYAQKITLHPSMDAKWGDRTKDNVPKRTVSCAQKVVCSNHYGYVFVATGTSILCLDQATFKQQHTTFEWTCTAPQVQCDNLSDLRMDVSEGPQLCLVVSNQTSLSLLNHNDGTVRQTETTTSNIVQCKWNSDSMQLAVVLDNGTLSLYDRDLTLLFTNAAASATCVSWCAKKGGLCVGTARGAVETYRVTDGAALQVDVVHSTPVRIEKGAEVTNKSVVHVHWIEQETIVVVHRTSEVFDDDEQEEQYTYHSHFVHMLHLDRAEEPWEHLHSGQQDEGTGLFGPGIELGGLPKLELQKLKVLPEMTTLYVPDVRMVVFLQPHTYEWASNLGNPMVVWKHPRLDDDGGGGGGGGGGAWCLCHKQSMTVDINEANCYGAPTTTNKDEDASAEDDITRENVVLDSCMSMSMDDVHPVLFHLMCLTELDEPNEEGREEEDNTNEVWCGPLQKTSYVVSCSKLAFRFAKHVETSIDGERKEYPVLPCVAAYHQSPAKQSQKNIKNVCPITASTPTTAPATSFGFTAPTTTSTTKALPIQTPFGTRETNSTAKQMVPTPHSISRQETKEVEPKFNPVLTPSGGPGEKKAATREQDDDDDTTNHLSDKEKSKRKKKLLKKQAMEKKHQEEMAQMDMSSEEEEEEEEDSSSLPVLQTAPAQKEPEACELLPDPTAVFEERMKPHHVPQKDQNHYALIALDLLSEYHQSLNKSFQFIHSLQEMSAPDGVDASIEELMNLQDIKRQELAPELEM